MRGRGGAEVERERMVLGVAAYGAEAEVVGVPAIEASDAVGHVVAVLVDRVNRRPRPRRGEQPE